MISKLGDVDIKTGHAFDGCKLNRKKYAEILTQIVSQYNQGCVLAINGEWGTGKTTFVKMWKQYLEDDKFHTLYFNAWENDFISDPLIGFIGEFKELNIDNKLDTELNNVTTNASKIAFSLIKGYINLKTGSDVAKTFKECTDLLSKEFENYEDQKNSIEGFRTALEAFIKGCETRKPIIFFVDELDRCSPSYAVKVLERIKHLFSIPNIVFVLSVDKKQLCNAIKGYYGSESLDAENYLKRFIDIEYNLPEPSYEDFCNYLYDKFEIGTYINNLEYGNNYKSFSIKLFQHNKLSLRQMEKIYSHVSLAISCNKKLRCDSLLFLFFVFIKVCHSNIYTWFEQKKYEEPQEFVNALEPFMPERSPNFDTSSYVLAEAICVNFSQFGISSRIDIKSKIENVIFRKTDKNVINPTIESFSLGSGLSFTYATLTQAIDLLINFD